MDALNLPAFDAKIAQRDGKHVIFDVIRRRYVALTGRMGAPAFHAFSAGSERLSARATGQ